MGEHACVCRAVSTCRTSGLLRAVRRVGPQRRPSALCGSWHPWSCQGTVSDVLSLGPLAGSGSEGAGGLAPCVVGLTSFSLK